MSKLKIAVNPKNWGELEEWSVNTPYGKKTRKEIKNLITLWSKDIPYYRLARLLGVGSSYVIEEFINRENSIPKCVGIRIGFIMQRRKLKKSRWKERKLTLHERCSS